MLKNESTRRNWFRITGLAFAGMAFAKIKTVATPALDSNKNIAKNPTNQQFQNETNLKLGNFSVSLNVKDIHASKQFYENLGFKSFAGDITQNWLVLKNGSSIIGLFQGMFEKNMLTFNPGWDENANKIEKFDDIRVIQKQLKEKGVKFESEADEKTTGPASFIILDPDGNPILLDQFV